jgi:uncharacterized protein (DUF302 family)
MKYYISKKINTNFEQAVHLTESLKKEGFGILTEINLQEKLKEKLDVDFGNTKYLVPAIQPMPTKQYSRKMEPCFLVALSFRNWQNNEIEVAAVDPIASMMAIENQGLVDIATEIKEKLERAIASL